ncbi:MAG TPA: LuxR C-terminal-related transcriptional regulator [Burkholderiales bacterium]|nr:LuxR C-terminal-related transcriptional regulator [Burkholderiales bacterium]
MPSQKASQLTNRELRAALDVLHAIGEGCAGGADFAARGVKWLPRLVASELTTLSVCDLDQGHRSVVTDHPGAISPRAIEVFDRYVHEHPLVREHGRDPGAVTLRITDCVAADAFRASPLYNEYYRAIRIDQVTAVPIHVDRRFLVSFVLNRSRFPFTDRERDLLEIARPHLANLYRLGIAADRVREVPADISFDVAAVPLTPREREVLDWVAAGKTNRDIAAILGASPRTVEKHLERIYEKLGVETRTAAAMRAVKLFRHH